MFYQLKSILFLFLFISIGMTHISGCGKKEADKEVEKKVNTAIEMLNSGDPVACIKAARCLIGIGPKAKAAVAPLIDALKHDDPVLRAEIARALVSMGPQAEEAIAPLIDLLKDSRSLVEIVSGPGIPDPFGIESGGTSPGEEAAKALSAIGKAAVEPLISALDVKSDFARARAVDALGGIEDPRT